MEDGIDEYTARRQADADFAHEQRIRDEAYAAGVAAERERWDMPRRKRETLQRRHDYLRSIPHDQRNQFMEAEISALDWVLHRVRA